MVINQQNLSIRMTHTCSMHHFLLDVMYPNSSWLKEIVDFSFKLTLTDAFIRLFFSELASQQVVWRIISIPLIGESFKIPESIIIPELGVIRCKIYNPNKWDIGIPQLVTEKCISMVKLQINEYSLSPVLNTFSPFAYYW